MRKKGPKRHNYQLRNAVVRGLGHKNYAEYLKSPLWISIRRRVLNAQGNKCNLCGGKAECIHHDTYTQANLLGHSFNGLVALCNSCHRNIEFNASGEKIVPAGIRPNNRTTQRATNKRAKRVRQALEDKANNELAIKRVQRQFERPTAIEPDPETPAQESPLTWPRFRRKD